MAYCNIWCALRGANQIISKVLFVNQHLSDKYLKRIIKLHVPVSLGAVGVRYDGGVVTHVVVQAERDSDPWPDDGYKLF